MQSIEQTSAWEVFTSNCPLHVCQSTQNIQRVNFVTALNISQGTSWICVVFKEDCLAGNYGYLFILYDN